MDKYLQCIYEEYRVDQANLIRNINDHLPFIVLSPVAELLLKTKVLKIMNNKSIIHGKT